MNQVRRVLDSFVVGLQKIVDRLGHNGYLLYGFLSNTLFFGASMVVKSSPQIDWTACVIMRGLLTFVCSYILSVVYNIDLTYPKSNLKYISIRNTISSLQQVFFYYVVTVIPIKVVWVTNNSGPIFVFVASACILGTRLTKREIGFLLLSVLGINIITVPQVILNILAMILPIENEVGLIEQEMDSFQMLISLFFVASIACWAVGIILVTFAKQATPVSLNYQFGLQLTIFGAISVICRAETVQFPTISEWMFIGAFVALPTFVCQLLYFQGTIMAKDQGMLSLTNYIPVIYSYIYQIIYQSRVPGVIELVGVFFTFYGLFKVVLRPKPKDSIARDKSLRSSEKAGGQENGEEEDYNEDSTPEKIKLIARLTL